MRTWAEQEGREAAASRVCAGGQEDQRVCRHLLWAPHFARKEHGEKCRGFLIMRVL